MILQRFVRFPLLPRWRCCGGYGGVRRVGAEVGGVVPERLEVTGQDVSGVLAGEKCPAREPEREAAVPPSSTCTFELEWA
jgi:hypothetical protein